MVKILKEFSACLILLVLSIGGASTDERPTVIIASMDDYRPYSYLENNRAEGLHNDIARELFRRAGYSMEIRSVPFKRALASMQHGSVTGMSGLFSTPEREKFATYLYDYPITQISVSLFVHQDSPIKTPAVNELEGKNIGVRRGFIMTPEIDSAANTGYFTLTQVSHVDQLIRMLKARRIDGFYYDTNTTQYYINQIDKDATIQQITPPISTPRNVYFSFSTKSLEKLPESFLDDANEALTAMNLDGTIKALHDKHNIIFAF